MRRLLLRGLSVSGIALAVVAAGGAADGYHVTKRLSIPGDTGWDYITADTDGRRLYVPHGIELVVLDLDTGATVGRVRVRRACMVWLLLVMLAADSSAPRTQAQSRSSI